MKNSLLILFFPVFFLINCSDKDPVITQKEDKNLQYKKSFTDMTNDSYKGQLSYVNGDLDNSLEFAVKNNFDELLKDSNIKWDYFDNLYVDNLTSTEKQYLTYIILSQKDLLGDYKLNPSPNKLLKIEKYTKMLINEKYVGYCLLYNCLQAFIGTSIESQVNKMASQISDYASSNNFHNYFMTSFPENDPQLSVFYSKIKEDYTYLDKINSLK